MIHLPFLGRRFCYLFLIGLFVSCQANHSENPPETDLVFDLPKWTWPILQKPEFKNNYYFDQSINPFYLNADLDKDGLADIAILVRAKATGKRAIALIRQADQEVFTVLGQSKKDTSDYPDFNWLRTWKAETILPAGAGITPGGAVLILFPKEINQPSPWLYWNGNAWQFKAE